MAKKKNNRKKKSQLPVIGKFKITGKIKAELARIAKRRLPVLMWDSIAGWEEVDADRALEIAKELNWEVNENFDPNNRYNVPIVKTPYSDDKPNVVEWNTHLRKLKSEFRQFGTAGVENYINEVDKKAAEYKVKHPHYYHLADERIWEVNPNDEQLMWNYMDARLNYEILTF